jgi:hypothetical protein
MEIVSGDIFIFIGGVKSRIEHFNNFKLGDKYIISSKGTIGNYDDLYTDSKWEKVVYFINTNYAVYEHELKEHFVRLEDYSETIMEMLNL